MADRKTACCTTATEREARPATTPFFRSGGGKRRTCFPKMEGLRHDEKRAQLALGAGLPLPLLLLLPMLLVIGAKGTSDIQAVRPSSARNGIMDHQVRPTASVGGGGGDHSPRALSTDPLEEKGESGGVPIATRLVSTDGFNWLDELSSLRRSLLTAAAVAPAAASVGGSDLQRKSDPQRQRGMQTVCSPSDDLSLISTVHTEASGCYFQRANDTSTYLTADSDRIVLPLSISASSSAGEAFAWVAGKVLGVSGGALDVDPECVSDEPWRVNSHPADAGSWSCLVGGTLVPFSQESFGIECGCSKDSSDTAVGEGTTPAPASGRNPSTSATGPSPSPAWWLSCGADSITITSPQLDGFEGCYTETGVVNGTSHYDQSSGELGDGINAVFAASIDERGHDVRWVAGTYANMSTDSGIVPTCISDDNATSTHPADSTWLCDLTGTDAFIPVNEMYFQVSCGCESPSSSSNTNSEELTPSPGDSSRNISTGTVESGANGGSRTCASGAFSAFGLTGLVAVVGLVSLFVGE